MCTSCSENKEMAKDALVSEVLTEAQIKNIANEEAEEETAGEGSTEAPLVSEKPAVDVAPTVSTGNGQNALGITSVILAVLSFFVLTIVLAPIALYLGFKSKKEEGSSWAVPGIIVSGIATAYVVISLMLGAAAFGFLVSGQ